MGVRTEVIENFLIKTLRDDPHERVRGEAAFALGSFRGSRRMDWSTLSPARQQRPTQVKGLTAIGEGQTSGVPCVR